MCNNIVYHNNLRLLKWVINREYYSYRIIRYIVKSVSSPYKINKYHAIDYAAGNGNLDMIKYLHENGCLWDVQTCMRAANNNRLEVLKYLRENGCPWNEWTCCMAALNGHLDVLKWAHEIGCPWDDWTCRSAANLEILKYARENGCPWNGWVYRNAESKKDLGMLKYARDNDCPELPTYLITGTDGITKYL